MLKKKFTLVLLSTLFGIILGYLIFFFLYFSEYDKKIKNIIIPKENLKIIVKYLNIVNHLRSYDITNSSELIFSVINPFNNQTNILMQGDSWFEQINFPANDDAESYFDVNIIDPKENQLGSLNYILKWANDKNIGVINSGTGSYSPSLMSVQLDILEKDFKIFPDIIIAYIDQTDFGDENCRYFYSKVYESKKLTRVKATKSFDKSIFNYTKVIRLSEINFNFDTKFSKVFNSLNYEIYWTIHKFITINKLRFQNIFKVKKISKCDISEIISYLNNPNQSEIEYFRNSIDEYLNKILSKQHIKQVYFVTFPHKHQLENILKKNKTEIINISDLIDEIILKKNINSQKKIYHINFSKLISSNPELYKPNDYLFDNIHLKQKPHERFISEIFKNIDLRN